MTATSGPTGSEHPTLSLSSGIVQGRRERGVDVYRGIPYAAAPTGGLRFAPPAPAPAWAGVRDAGAFGPSPLQNLDPLSLAMPGAENYYYRADTAKFDEDALSVNVWTPAIADGHEGARAALPVLVWIHGGGFLTGSGASDWFDGARLARREGIVVVTISYRLGVLGNLWLGDLDERADTSDPQARSLARQATNLGTRDQIAALEWVRDEIAAFGGDPAHVTVAGQSAGGMSVIALLVSPLAKGLFRGAIVQSGHADLFQSPAAARASTDRILTSLRIGRDENTLAELRKVSTLRLLEAQRLLPIGTVAPTLDGDVLPHDALQALRDGWAAEIPLIIGTTEAENALFRVTGMPGLPTGLTLREGIEGLAGGAADRGGTALDSQLVDTAIDEYRRGGVSDDEAWNRATSDVGWRLPVEEFVAAYREGGGRVHRYEYAWRSPARHGGVGAAHEVDVPFVFDSLDAPGVDELLGAGVADDAGAKALARAIGSAWGAFVRTGNPDTDLLPSWRPVGDDSRPTLVFDITSRLTEDPHPARTALWDGRRVPNPLIG